MERVFEELREHVDRHMTRPGFHIAVHDVDKLSEEAYARVRCDFFGASDSAVLCGVAFSSKDVPMKTMTELRNEKINNFVDLEIGKKPSVRKGKDLEAFIISELPFTIVKPFNMYCDDNRLSTNFDGVSINPEGWLIPHEIKYCTTYGRKNYNYQLAGIKWTYRNIDERKTSIQDHIEYQAKLFGIPPYYYTQLQQQIYMLDAPMGYLHVRDEVDWVTYSFEIPRDNRVIYHIVDAIRPWAAQLSLKKQLPLSSNLTQYIENQADNTI